jgi:hypothetical protein
VVTSTDSGRRDEEREPSPLREPFPLLVLLLRCGSGTRAMGGFPPPKNAMILSQNDFGAGGLGVVFCR